MIEPATRSRNVSIRVTLPADVASLVRNYAMILDMTPSKLMRFAFWTLLNDYQGGALLKLAGADPRVRRLFLERLPDGRGGEASFTVEPDFAGRQIALGVSGEVRIAPGTSCRVALMFLQDVREPEFVGKTVEVR